MQQVLTAGAMHEHLNEMLAIPVRVVARDVLQHGSPVLVGGGGRLHIIIILILLFILIPVFMLLPCTCWLTAWQAFCGWQSCKVGNGPQLKDRCHQTRNQLARSQPFKMHTMILSKCWYTSWQALCMQRLTNDADPHHHFKGQGETTPAVRVSHNSKAITGKDEQRHNIPGYYLR